MREKLRIKTDNKPVYTTDTLILFFFLFSIIGWLWEVFYFYEGDHVLVNRGFFVGPWLPIYGTGGVLILLLLKHYFHKPLLLFFLIAALCGVVEYITSWLMEILFHRKWWDYSDYTFQIQGRISLVGLVFFGLGGLFLVYVLAPRLNQLIQCMGMHTRKLLCAVLMIIFALDVVYSFWNPNMGEGITYPPQG